MLGFQVNSAGLLELVGGLLLPGGTATVNKLLMGAIASAWGAEVNADAGSGILAERA